MQEGESKRISVSATEELDESLEEIGFKIANEEIDYAMHNRRKMVEANNIKIAARKIVGR